MNFRKPRNDDLPGARFLRAMDREQVAFQDAGIAHRHAANAQKEVSARGE